MTLAEMSIRMLDDICAFACTVPDEEDRTLLKIFCVAVFVDDCRGSFGDLLAVLEYGCIDFHAAGVDHWNDISI